MTKILDCTTRDGGCDCNWDFTDEFIFSQIAALNDLNIDYYEIGYRNYTDAQTRGRFYRCSAQMLEKFYSSKLKLQIGVMTDLSRFCADDFAGADKDFVDFVRIACHPNAICDCLDCAQLLYDRGYKVFVHLMQVNGIDESGYSILKKYRNKKILESLYFADTCGELFPADISKFYNKLKDFGYERLSFHAHNKINTACANTLEAIKLGAYSVDVTDNGIGRSGGNLSRLELLGKI